MNALLVRVGADRSASGGSWNGPVDGDSGDFAYVAIPETSPVHSGTEKPYNSLTSVLARFRVTLPPYLQALAEPGFSSRRRKAARVEKGSCIDTFPGCAGAREETDREHLGVGDPLQGVRAVQFP